MATNSRKPVTLDHIRSTKKPVTKTVRFANDPEITERLEQIENEHLQTTLAFRLNNEDEVAKKKLADLQEEKDRLLEEASKNSTRFVFRSLGRNRFDELRTAHPPTEADRKRAREMGQNPDELGWDLDEFPKELISACCMDPELTPEDVKQMFDDELFSSAEMSELFNAAVQVNLRSNVVNLGKEFRGTSNSTQS
jgi:hypothetical protein